MTDLPIYASDDDPAPDSAFVAGDLRYLVGGNRGRLLDARRTPVTIVRVAPGNGSFVVRIDAFEDAGACWELGFEEIGRFQFSRSATPATPAALEELERGAARFDRDVSIACDPAARAATLGRLQERRAYLQAWFADRASELNVDVSEQIRRRQGVPALYTLLDTFLGDRGLLEIERAFAAGFVTNPRAGEIVKGHAIVLAELGLCAYRGRAPRDPDLFAGAWSRPRRADHLLWRLAFTQELWHALGHDDLDLYRAATTERAAIRATPAVTFVSATFSRQVADAHFQGGPATRVAVMWRQRVALERAVMTFIETKEMNERFHEAEAVLLADPSSPAF